jgi:hypothetical protein
LNLNFTEKTEGTFEIRIENKTIAITNATDITWKLINAYKVPEKPLPDQFGKFYQYVLNAKHCQAGQN